MKRTHSGIVRVERVQVFIGGVSSSDAAALTTYLHQFSGFVGHISVTVFNGFARAVFAGGGAHRGVLGIIGRHVGNKFICEVKCDRNDWFCPCGLSGSCALFAHERCAHCGGSKPSNLLYALQTVEAVSAQDLTSQLWQEPRRQTAAELSAAMDLSRTADTLWSDNGGIISWQHRQHFIFKSLNACLEVCKQNGDV